MKEAYIEEYLTTRPLMLVKICREKDKD